jgi:hypothetical protein
LASESEIRKAVKSLLNLDVKPTSSEGAALAAFDQVCQLRHAAVHARGQLGAGNMSVLSPAVRPGTRMIVALDAVAFQSLVSQAHNAVRAMNQFLFDCTIDRWWKKNFLTGRWNDDREAFESLARLCISTTDNEALAAEQVHKQIVAAKLEASAGGG